MSLTRRSGGHLWMLYAFAWFQLFCNKIQTNKAILKPTFLFRSPFENFRLEWCTYTTFSIQQPIDYYSPFVEYICGVWSLMYLLAHTLSGSIDTNINKSQRNEFSLNFPLFFRFSLFTTALAFAHFCFILTIFEMRWGMLQSVCCHSIQNGH